MTIHTIIWDLGGVLVRTEDWEPRDRLASRLGMTRQEISDLVFGTKVNARAQLGEISAAQQWQHVAQTLNLPEAEIPALRAAFFGGDRLDTDLIDAIRGLRAQYHIALLSNAFSDLRQTLVDEWQIDDVFHTIVISAEVGIMKPDTAIYDLTIEKTGFEPHEAVFIDDFAHNIEGARMAGLHAIHFKDPQQALPDLQKLLDKENSS
jgi:epoxide hydrolase-like predicted phosphatase